MKKIVRHTIFAFFVLLFLISAPLLLFFATGYRYNFAKGKVEPTGHILVTSLPKNAEVSVNGQLQTDPWQFVLGSSHLRTPARLKNLLSGDYSIVLTKDGYWPWQRRVSVSPQTTTFITDVSLLRKVNPLKEVSQEGILQYRVVSPSRILYATTSTLYAFDRATKGLAAVWQSPDDVVGFTPSLDGRFVVVRTKSALIILEDENTSFSVKSSLTAKGSVWTRQNTLVAFDDSILFTFNPETLKRSDIERIEARDVSVRDEVMFYLSSYGKGMALWSIDGSNKLKKLVVELPVKDATLLSEGSEKYVVIRSGVGLYVVERESPNHVTEIPHGIAIAWIDQDSAYIGTDFELWRYRFEGERHDQEFITRRGEPIGVLAGVGELPYVFFTKDASALLALEANTNESPNMYTIAEGEVRALSIEPKLKELFFLGTVGGMQGIWSILLKE